MNRNENAVLLQEVTKDIKWGKIPIELFVALTYLIMLDFTGDWVLIGVVRVRPQSIRLNKLTRSRELLMIIPWKLEGVVNATYRNLKKFNSDFLCCFS